MDGSLDATPGFRRRFRIEPAPGRVVAAVEDDFHAMAVMLRHDGRVVTAVDAMMDRAPWTTCPGAAAVLQRAFEGAALADFATLGGKTQHCTHLYDLALLAAAHAGDSAAVRYEVVTSDPDAAGLVASEIRRNGAVVLALRLEHDIVIEPAEASGMHLFKLRPWIETLTPDLREAARILQWATLIAHGRTTPMELQSDASRMPPNCFTFQPENAQKARRVGKSVDFSESGAVPLGRFDGQKFADDAPVSTAAS